MEDVTTNLMCVNVSPTGGLLGTAAYTRDLVSTAPLQEGPVRQALPRASANQDMRVHNALFRHVTDVEMDVVTMALKVKYAPATLAGSTISVSRRKKVLIPLTDPARK